MFSWNNCPGYLIDVKLFYSEVQRHGFDKKYLNNKIGGCNELKPGKKKTGNNYFYNTVSKYSNFTFYNNME